MTQHPFDPIAIVGLAAIMPDAPNATAFWENIKAGRYSISDVPPLRWDPDLYYDADRNAPDKTYSRIGGWVREFPWDPMGWRLPLPPKVAEQMDDAQKWALSAARSALIDAGWPDWDVDPEQVAVILGNAIGGEKHYATCMRIVLPEMLRELEAAPSFASLPADVRQTIVDEARKGYLANFVEINEDTMPGELANVTAGRIANLFNFRGPNFTTDAACASGLAGMWSAAQGLASHQYDVAISGGVDRNMGVTSFVKFCKIGALSATGTRPFDAGADGFVMGEGAAIFVMKRLADAERAGDRIYAVLLGMAGSSDGKGKGITAPNPAGQRLAIAHAWQQAGIDPAAASAVEAHGTSTRVGDAAELESLTSVFGPAGAAPGAIALGSVKSNIGHLKAAAGTAGLLKMVLSLHEKVLAPSLNFRDPNPNVDWASSPFRVNSDLREWPVPPGGVRLGAVSAFGFGGTNFHAVLEEYVPGRHASPQRSSFAGVELPKAAVVSESAASGPDGRRALVLGGASDDDVVAQLERVRTDALAGHIPERADLDPALGGAASRLAIDYADAAELATKADKALKAFAAGNPAIWRLLKSQGVFLGHGPAPKVAFLYTGQGSQYVNMLKPLRESEPIVRDTFAEADEIMAPLLGQPLSSYVFSDSDDPETVARLDRQLLQTEITQPAVLTCDIALTRMLAAHGVRPDMVMGHSLGEYGALVAAGALDFSAALEAVSARGHEMASLDIDDNGAMAAVFGPLPQIEQIVAEADGYVVVANVNSNSQAVVGGATEAVERIVETFEAAGLTARRIPVSHAFHTSIVAPISTPLQEVLRRLDARGPTLPIVANVTGEFYPTDADSETMVEILGRQVASPVQFVKGLHTLYDAGARVFVEVGPKKALHGFVEDVFGPEHDDVLALFTNHPKLRDATAFNQAMCGLYAAGLGLPQSESPASRSSNGAAATPVTPPAMTLPAAETTSTEPRTTMHTDRYVELGKVFADFLERGRRIYDGEAAPAPAAAANGLAAHEPVVVTGAALGLPGVERVFDDENVGRILGGQQFIDAIPHHLRQAMVDKHITRLIKPESGEPSFVAIDDEAGVIKLAGRRAPFDVVTEFGIDEARDAALDSATRLAIGAGFDAMRDAGIPLVMRYRTTTLGTRLPDRWGLPDEMRDDTGIVFASAFPGYGEFAKDMERYLEDRGRRHELASLEAVRSRMSGDEAAIAEVDRRIAELQQLLATEPFAFDRRFIFRCLAMGHSQFAELIGARGPNTQVNAACASTTQALCIAEDWIRTGRARRVVVIAADDVTDDTLLPWIGSGFLASGAAATDDVVEDAAVPFDRRRHGMIVGMGAAAIVVESADAARERGIQPICEVLGAVTANSAFHGTRLDVAHVSQVMERLLRQVEARGIDRMAMAASTMFVSHETYTPARGGSAAAEISALRSAFGSAADDVVVTNTKGFTGHAMGAGIEDVVAIKALETGIVPPVPNFKEPDPELGDLNLSTGGAYPVEYALRLAAGFGSQIAMAVLRWTPMPDRKHRSPDLLGFRYRIADPVVWHGWLRRVSGQPDAELEVVQHRLRVMDKHAQPSAPAPAPAPAPAVARAVVARAVVPEPVVPEPVVPEPVVPVAVVAPVVASRADMVDAVVSIVSEMTGYPPELLDLDLDLEADLGVDTVKQAEVFAAVRARYGVERDENLKLRDFPTLNHVVGWISDKVAAVPAPVESAPVVEPVVPAVPVPVAVVPVAVVAPVVASRADMVDAVVSIVSEMTGYPPELLDLDLDLEADLGVDTVKQAEVFAAVRARYGVERDENLRLRDFPTLNHVVGWISDKVAAVPAPVESAPAVEPVVPAVPVAVVPVAVVAPVVASRADMVDAVVSIVSEMTGYPPELLDLDLDLEADLGVDTVKQAEVFAAVRARYGVERDENLRLRDFPTLNHVVGWISDKVAAVPAPVEPEPVVPTAGQSSGPTEQAVAGDLAATDKYPRRIPVPVLRPSLDLCKRTGVALDRGHRVVVMLDEGAVGAKLVERLTERGCTSLVLDAGIDAEQLANTLDGWLADAPVSGVYWLAALDDEGPIEAMDLAAWHEALARRVKNLYVTMRHLYGSEPFLVAATRLGGYHGYDATGATAPLGGAVSGFAKAYRRELPDALVKIVDVPGGRDPAAVADRLVEETLRDPGCVEVGYPDDGLRWTVGLADEPFGPATQKPLDAESIFVVTGAAGSIVSAITADLARASGGTFHLLDLTPAPDPDDPDLQRFTTDKDGLKTDLAARMKQAGQRPTPVLIEKELARIERLASAQAAVQAVTAAGGTARYHQVDLTDAAAVTRVMGEVRDTSGRVDVLLHAAGLDVSRSLHDKERREFDLVFDVKSDGWFNVLHAMGDMPLGATVAFSSVAGRFGNVGQTDYSAANDLLCKLTSNLRRTRPETRAIALDWTAWAGIGMATRGSIPKVMQMAGIETLDPDAGTCWIRRELTSGAAAGEVLVAGALGRLADEFDETGGIEAGKVPAGSGPMMGMIEAVGVYSGLVVRTTLDPKQQPFLNDHRIDGIAVLPGVMGIEAFAEVARLLVPSWHVVAVEDVEFVAPVKFYRDEPRTLTIRATIRPDGRYLLAGCTLEGERLLPGSDEAQHTTHFTATVRLAANAPEREHADAVTEAIETVGGERVYDLYFHGPAFQVVSSSWRYNGGNAARMADGLPDDHVPMGAPTFVGPRLVELCFQTAGLWEAAHHGRLALPRHVDAVRLLREPAEISGSLYAVANEIGDHFDCSIRDADGEVVLTVEGYGTTPLPVPVSADVQQGLGALVAEVLPT